MREIKFRQWGLYTKHMWTWEELQDTYLRHLNPEGAVITMQYIGLKDKNSKDIYEGDRIRWLGHEVKHGKQIRPERIIVVTDSIYNWAKIANIIELTAFEAEIISNIYESPEAK